MGALANMAWGHFACPGSVFPILANLGDYGARRVDYLPISPILGKRGLLAKYGRIGRSGRGAFRLAKYGRIGRSGRGAFRLAKYGRVGRSGRGAFRLGAQCFSRAGNAPPYFGTANDFDAQGDAYFPIPKI